MSGSSRSRVMLVDGMALLFRAFYATSYGGYIMKTSAGVPTNAVYQFVKYFGDAVKRFRPTHVACCWDMGSSTFRTEQFESYKANRDEAPEELIPQFSLVKDVVDSFKVPNIGVVGYEADDCIGTIAKTIDGDADVYILTGDHDMLQLIDHRVRVIIMKKGQSNYLVYDEEVLKEERGLTPRQIIDLKGLMGDTSDNYPGVKGIGEKTALKLLWEYEHVEGILDNLHQLPKGVRSKIEQDLDMLHLSRKLAAIRCDVPLEITLDACRWEPDAEKIQAKFEELEFEGLMKSVPGLAKIG